jgi:hypothetical protein
MLSAAPFAPATNHEEVPVSGIWKFTLWVIAWALTALAALSVAWLPGDFGESLCGPWGCLPPLQALAAMHLFWAVAFVPFVAWGPTKAKPRQLRLVGMLVFLGSLLAIVVVIGRDLLGWLPQMPADVQAFWPRRALYTLATLSDVPLVQGLLAGAICWSVGQVRVRRGEQSMQRVLSGKVVGIVIGLSLSVVSWTAAAQPVAMKIQAPELKGIDEWINSKPRSMKDLKGKVVVLHFWALG